MIPNVRGHCFDVDTINKQVSWVYKTTVYGLDEEKETCRWDLVDNWIDFAKVNLNFSIPHVK